MSEDKDPNPVLSSIERLEGVVNEHERTIKSALHELRDLVVKQYARTMETVDDHSRRLRVIEQQLGIIPHTDGL